MSAFVCEMKCSLDAVVEITVYGSKGKRWATGRYAILETKSKVCGIAIRILFIRTAISIFRKINFLQPNIALYSIIFLYFEFKDKAFYIQDGLHMI